LHIRGMILLILAIHTVLSGCGYDGPAASSKQRAMPIESRYSAFIGATEFVIGENRLSFTLRSREGASLEGEEVSVRLHSANSDSDSFFEATAEYHSIQTETPHGHADGHIHHHVHQQGIYVVDRVPLTEAGIWLTEFTVIPMDVTPIEIEGFAFSVIDKPSAPGIGTHISDIVGGVTTEGSHVKIPISLPADGLPEHASIGSVMDGRSPVIVVFASPEFCTSAMCGPVTQVAGMVAARFSGQIHAIRIDPYDLNAARGDGSLRITPQVQNWNLPTEPWTFVISSDGFIIARFEGLFGPEELAKVISTAL
jgi:hypothetical protein